MIKLLTCLLGSAGLAGLVPVVAHAEPVNHPAEGGIGEIVVTAQKKAENAQTTPIAITAYSGDSLSSTLYDYDQVQFQNMPLVAMCSSA